VKITTDHVVAGFPIAMAGIANRVQLKWHGAMGRGRVIIHKSALYFDLASRREAHTIYTRHRLDGGFSDQNKS
jgi:hypothetical protein